MGEKIKYYLWRSKKDPFIIFMVDYFVTDKITGKLKIDGQPDYTIDTEVELVFTGNSKADCMAFAKTLQQ